MKNVLENIDWLVIMPATIGLLYFILVRSLWLSLFLTKTNQVNAMGIGLVIGILIVLEVKEVNANFFLYGMILLAVANFIDDLINVHFAWRLIVQFIACSFLLMEHGLFYSYWSPVVLVLIVGYINAFNFMDGINGYVSMYSFTIFIPYLFLTSLQIESFFIIWSTIAFLSVFIFFNFRTKSLAWLGDTGSIALAYLSLHVFFNEFKGYQLYLFIVFAAVFLIDSGYTMTMRQMKGEDVFKRHQTHLYQLITSKPNVKSYWWIAIVVIIQFLVNVYIINMDVTRTQFAVSSAIVFTVFIFYLVVRNKIVKS